jgi:hypothetical protein
VSRFRRWLELRIAGHQSNRIGARKNLSLRQPYECVRRAAHKFVDTDSPAPGFDKAAFSSSRALNRDVEYHRDAQKALLRALVV